MDKDGLSILAAEANRLKMRCEKSAAKDGFIVDKCLWTTCVASFDIQDGTHALVDGLHCATHASRPLVWGER